MKSKSIVFIALVATVFSCTTEPLLPPGFTGAGGTGSTNNDGTCADGIISFEHQILPLLVSNCAMSGCHDEITREDGVVLTNYENVMREVKANSPNNSELYESITDNGDDIMPPPPATFSQDQIQLIKDWINQGALNTTCLTDCDSTVTATFAAVVYPIVESNCIGCHNNSLSEGGVKLNSYTQIKTYVDAGNFMGTIEHKPGYPVMPTSGVKISDCQISLLNQWIANGALDN